MSSYLKYTPNNLDAAVLPATLRAAFESMKSSGVIQNMLFYGKPGTGKTTVAKLLSENTEVVRCDSILETPTEILVHATRIASSMNLFAENDTKRVVVLDEIDRFNVAIQEKVRSLIDDYGSNAIFIGTTNNLHQVIPALQSRMKPISFDVDRSSITMRDFWRKRLDDIFQLENSSAAPIARIEHAMRYFPDGRQMIINLLAPLPN